MSDLNDPRVFFAAERTLLAWTRTSLTFLAFGFMVERFGLFLVLLKVSNVIAFERGFSYWIGILFMLLGAASAALSVVQYRKVLITLKPVEIPQGYASNTGVFVNVAVATLGMALVFYLITGVHN